MPESHQRHDGQQSRRYFLQVLCRTASVALLTACTPLISSSASPATIPPPTDKATDKTTVDKTTVDKTTVVFWGAAHHPLELAAKGFVAAHPEFVWDSPHPVNQVEKLKTALATGSGVPDLYWSEAPLAQGWGCQKLLTDLTDELAPVLKDYHPAKLAETTVGKQRKQIGWPGDLGVSGWYYRQDKLAALGWQAADLSALTWPAFIELTADLRAQGLYTYAFPPNGWSPLFFLLLHQVGGSAIREDGKRIMIGGEKGIQAMRLLKKLWEAGGGLAVEWQQAAYWDALKTGQLIGDFAPAWARPTWEANLQESGEAGGWGQWRVAPLPGGEGVPYRTGVWGGGQLVIPKAASNPDGALAFTQYALASVEGAAAYSAAGIVPAYRPYLTAKAFAEQRSPLFGDWSFGQFWAAQEQELSTAYFRPAGWEAVRTAVEQEMMAILSDTYSVEDGMSRIVDRALPEFMATRCG